MTTILIILGVVLIAVVALVFLRKGGADELPPAAQPEPLPPKKAEPAAKERKEPVADAPAKERKEKAAPAPTPKAEPAPTAAAKAETAKAAEEPSSDAGDEAASAPKAAAAARDARPALARRAADVAGLRKGLAKTRESEGFFGRLKSLFAGKKEIDPRLLEEIEEVLLTSDVGVKTTETLLASLRDRLDKKELADEDRVWAALRTEASRILDIGGGGLTLPAQPTVVMVVGVNGVGKTTTIGKLASRLTGEGKKVVLAAGDTFRAAAVQQLVVWGKRAGCEVVTGAEGSNSGAVIFDAIQKAKDIGADIVLADTAGRLHTKSNLMDELKKIQRTLGKALEGAPHETLLVLDATNGQNATQQAALFKEALPLTGIVLTKLDGTAKGGVILGICAEHAVPVRYIGIGERAEDLRDFQPEEFVEALLGNAADPAEAAA